MKAVEACRARGIRIIVATGRAMESAEPYRALLGAEGPMIYFNGAVIVSMPEEKILKETLLEVETAEYCADLAREMGVYCHIYFPAGFCPEGIDPALCGETRMVLIAERSDPEIEVYHKRTGMRAVMGDLNKALKSPVLEGCVKFMFLTEPEIQAVIRRRLKERFGETIYVASSARTFLEVMDAKASKGRGLEFAMERLSLKKEEVIAFGDEENDIPMLNAAGFSVAPSNAKDEVKVHADLVVAPNAEDGVAAFLEEFFG
jgi:hydroxymethylpyrimidine pyrophosphatase-like HAD family hydrolase